MAEHIDRARSVELAAREALRGRMRDYSESTTAAGWCSGIEAAIWSAHVREGDGAATAIVELATQLGGTWMWRIGGDRPEWVSLAAAGWTHDAPSAATKPNVKAAMGEPPHASTLRQEIERFAAARAAVEREACARVADLRRIVSPEQRSSEWERGYREAAELIAVQIRARGGERG